MSRRTRGPQRTTLDRTTVVVSVLSATITTLGVLSAPLIAEAAKNESPPPSTSCLDLQQKYYRAIRADPAQREAILGTSGNDTWLLTHRRKRAISLVSRNAIALTRFEGQ